MAAYATQPPSTGRPPRSHAGRQGGDIDVARQLPESYEVKRLTGDRLAGL
ncbi:hypothetical protein [Streptomyces sp. NPDC047061]